MKAMLHLAGWGRKLPHFTESFFIVIHIKQKFDFNLIQIVKQWLAQNFADGMCNICG